MKNLFRRSKKTPTDSSSVPLLRTKPSHSQGYQCVCASLTNAKGMKIVESAKNSLNILDNPEELDAVTATAADAADDEFNVQPLLAPSYTPPSVTPTTSTGLTGTANEQGGPPLDITKQPSRPPRPPRPQSARGAIDSIGAAPSLDGPAGGKKSRKIRKAKKLRKSKKPGKSRKRKSSKNKKTKN